MKESSINKSSEGDAENFYKRVVYEYLRSGSVDELMRGKTKLPVSYQGVYHILNRWGIVRASGPNTKLSYTIEFLSELVRKDMGVEQLYRRMPPSFKESTSVQTLYRVVQYIKMGVTRRSGTALIINCEDTPERVLVGNDISTPRLDVGKEFGSLSLPMGFSRRNEDPRQSILRVLQREVLSQMTIDRTFPQNIIPDNPSSLMTVSIADVSVSVYSISLPSSVVHGLSSPILQNLRFEEFGAVQYAEGVRAGVPDIINGYLSMGAKASSCEWSPIVSELNLSFAPLPVDS